MFSLLFNIGAVICHCFIRDKVSMAVLLNYGVISIALIGFDETYPVWAADSPKLGKYVYNTYCIVITFNLHRWAWIFCPTDHCVTDNHWSIPSTIYSTLFSYCEYSLIICIFAIYTALSTSLLIEIDLNSYNNGFYPQLSKYF